jgi:hypothetical protein
VKHSKLAQFVIIGSLLTASPLAAQGSLLLHAAIISANIADHATTQRGLNAGAYEANPLGRHGVTKMIILKSAGSAVTMGGVQYLWSHDKRTAAVILALVTSGMTATVAAHNYRVGSRKLHAQR